MRALLLVVVLLSGCAADVPIDALDAEGATPTTFALRDATGARDGAQTSARFVFADADGQELVLDVTLAYDPQPVLAGGKWTLGSNGGSVHAETVRFVGGQGEGPSVGGVYRLDDIDGSRFRVRIPLTRVGGGWNP